MNFANKISTFRILIVPFFASSLIYYYFYPQKNYLRVVALAIFMLGVISDAVDGYIARKSRQHSPAGLILDPLGDKLLLISAFICLCFFPAPIKFPIWVTIIIISRDAVILLGALLIFIMKQKMDILPTRWGKLTTIFQMASVISVLVQWSYSFVFWWLAAFFTVISGIDYIRRGFKTLYGLDNYRAVR